MCEESGKHIHVHNIICMCIHCMCNIRKMQVLHVHVYM